jgi:hypothetical protein
MANPPVSEQPATAAELDALFDKHGFEELLRRCEMYTLADRDCGPNHPLHPDTVYKLGYKYRLNGVTVAVVFYYTHANKTVTRHIRMLRVNNTKYYAPKQPPVHPQDV